MEGFKIIEQPLFVGPSSVLGEGYFWFMDRKTGFLSLGKDPFAALNLSNVKGGK